MPSVLVLDQYRTLIDFGLFVLIWLVQLTIYPSFLHTDRDSFRVWHYKYTGQISIFVAPLMFSESALYACLALRAGRWHDWLGLVIIGAIWCATILVSVPCHDRMQQDGFDRAVILRLIRTNWIRTAAWTLLVIIDLALGLLHG